jgi:hypothetical protein
MSGSGQPNARMRFNFVFFVSMGCNWCFYNLAENDKVSNFADLHRGG